MPSNDLTKRVHLCINDRVKVESLKQDLKLALRDNPAILQQPLDDRQKRLLGRTRLLLQVLEVLQHALIHLPLTFVLCTSVFPVKVQATFELVELFQGMTATELLSVLVDELDLAA
jgi:hypothetical protein